MIANFPNFSKLSIDTKSEIEKFTSQFEPYSDFNFTSLFCWDINATTEVSYLNNNIVVRMADYISGKNILTILGKTDLEETLAILYEYLHNTGQAQVLSLVPEIVIRSLDSKKYVIEDDRDNFDYLYSVSNLVDLAGSEFSTIRNYINKLFKSYSDRIDYSSINFENISEIKIIESIFKEWLSSYNKDINQNKNELLAIKRLIEYSNHLSIKGILLKIDDEPVGFSIFEKVDNTYVIYHFEKSTKRHSRLAMLLKHLSAITLEDMGCKYVNSEQDLGIPGLRQAKMSYHPVKFLKKYTVSLK